LAAGGSVGDNGNVSEPVARKGSGRTHDRADDLHRSD
jgi:hypothetical protein